MGPTLWVVVAALVAVPLFRLLATIWEYTSLTRKLEALANPEEDHPPDAELLARIAALHVPGKPRIALVLSGGGAKGAYQIGVWRALNSLGFRDFCAVSGTSVGALNAALIVQGQLRRAEDIWSKLTVSGVLRLNGFRSFRAFVVRLLMLPFLLLRLRAKWRGNLRPSFWEEYEQEYRKLKEMGTGWEIVAHVIAGWQTLLKSSEWLPCLFLTGLLALLGVFFKSLSAQTVGYGWAFRMLLAAIGLMPMLILAWRWLILEDQKLGRENPLASNAPLANLLADNIPATFTSDLKAPLLVTMASLRRVDPPPFDWEKFQRRAAARTKRSQPRTKLGLWWRENVTGEGPAAHYAAVPDTAISEPPSPITPFNPLPVKKVVDYVPYYFDLRQCNAELARRLVLQSAGLPEIFASMVMSGDDYVDGGTADNTPVLPVLESDPDLVLVVYLDNRPHREAIAKTVAGLRRRIASATEAFDRTTLEVSPENSASTLGSPLAITREPRLLRLITITPSTPLGGFLTGTLAFSPRRARLLMKLGYWDTLAALRQEPLTITA